MRNRDALNLILLTHSDSASDKKTKIKVEAIFMILIMVNSRSRLKLKSNVINKSSEFIASRNLMNDENSDHHFGYIFSNF